VGRASVARARRYKPLFVRTVQGQRGLVRLLDEHRPDAVFYEQAHHRGGAATELCVGFVTRVQELCAERGVEYQSVHSGTLKKHATGRGNAKKPEMIAAAEARWPGQKIEDDNQADALCLLAFAMEEVGV
jgi:Holliday junction resolvasome RuvABC endonuclease subunit